MSDFEMIEQEQNHKGFDDSNIEKESQIAIGLLFRKYNISISEFLNILKNYNPKELNTEKIIEIVLDMRK